MVPIEKCKTEIPIKKGSVYLFIKRTQFPLILVWASTVHKVRGLSSGKGEDFDPQKQIYMTFSRLKAFDNFTGEFETSAT